MKFSKPTRWSSSATCLLVASLCLVPSALSAHPGHYHPDETDEFDFLRATFFHSHGTVDYVLGAVAVSCIALSFLHGKPAIRLTAMIAALGSLALLPIL